MKIELEKIALGLFFLIALYFGMGNMLDHSIIHDFPYGYGASDAFQHQTRAESIKDAGNFRYEAAYLSLGIENSVGRYPPTLYHIAVVFANTAGIEAYDSILFIVAFFTIVAGLCFYYAVRPFNKTIALLCLPLSLLAFSFPASLGFLYGHWPSLLAQAFLVFVIWIVVQRELPYSFVLLGIGLGATALSHTSATIFAGLFLAVFYGLKLVFKKLDKKDIKTVSLGVALFLVVASYYLIIFLNTWAKAQPYEFSFHPIWNGNPGFYLVGFGLLLIFLLIGIVMGLMKIKETNAALIASLCLLIFGEMNYVGFDARAFQMRFFWPIYLSVLIALGIYVIIKLVAQWNLLTTGAALGILFFLASGVVALPALGKTSYTSIPMVAQMNQQPNQGIMNPYHWEALQWLSKNTEEDARLYFFFGSIYSQDALLRNSKRVHYQVAPDELIPIVSERRIERIYVSERPGDSGGRISIRKGLFDFEYQELSGEEIYGPQDICSFDYLVFDMQPEHPLIQYNMLIANQLANKGMTAVFQNDVVLVLKNNDVGGECIAPGTF